jgi:hypothetical protein
MYNRNTSIACMAQLHMEGACTSFLTAKDEIPTVKVGISVY